LEAFRHRVDSRRTFVSHAGQAVRSRRIALGLTQEDLAARIGGGVRQADISLFEHTGAGLREWDRLARALDLSPDELRARPDVPGSDGSIDTAIRAGETSPAASTANTTVDGALRHARQLVTMLEQLVQDTRRATHGERTTGGTGDGEHDRGDASR
jgi:transcriptional regulator with XRE-family HTH domain